VVCLMSSSNGNSMWSGKGRVRLTREKAQDILWKVAAAALVVFLIYVLLHFGSQLVELQGG
jgi:hypothetical protein